MKRHLSIALRLLLAAVGIGYILWSLTWVDVAVLPAGWALPSGGTLAEPVEAPVLERSAGGLLVALPDAQGEATPLRIDAAALGAEAHDVRYVPGIVTTLATANVAMLAGGFVLIGLIVPLQAWRWLLLMRCRGLDPGFGRSLRLSYVGLFFNFCMPGMTGGDVVKAYYAAKGSGRRGAAVMSVIFDRITGLLAMVLLAGLMGLTLLDDPLVARLTLGVWLTMAGLAIAAGVYFSTRLRRTLGIQRLLGRLRPDHPLVRIDQAAVAYRGHPRTVFAAVLISLPAHLVQVLAAALAGYALGLDLSLGLLLTVLPVVFFAGALPITYQGLGVMEAVAMGLLLAPPLATANEIVSMLVLVRLYLVGYALVGSLLMLRGNIHLFPEGLEEQVAVADSTAKPFPSV